MSEQPVKTEEREHAFDFVIPILWSEVKGKSLAESFGQAFGQTLNLLFGSEGALSEGMTVSKDEAGEIVYTFNNPGMQALYMATQGEDLDFEGVTAAYQRKGEA